MKELQAALRVLYPELQKELQVALRAIVKGLEGDAIQQAAAMGFAPPGTSGRGTGKLIGSIRSGVTMSKGYLKDTARNPRDDYPYPRRYEYQQEGARSFLRPVVDQNRDKIYASIEAVVTEVITKFNETQV